MTVPILEEKETNWLYKSGRLIIKIRAINKKNPTTTAVIANDFLTPFFCN